MRILYFSHIDWNWIFQRPQILALHLEKDYHIDVLVRKMVFDKNYKSNNKIPKRLKKVFILPRDYQYKLLLYINNLLIKRIIKWNQFDAIWITYPYLYHYIPKNFTGKIIYDCMDLHVDMAAEKLKENMFEIEQALISRADLVFVSSERLQNIVPNIKKSILLRNGYISQNSYDIKEKEIKKNYVISYIGTIASWFDFELLENNTTKNNKVKYYLYGPTEKGIEEIYSGLSENIVFKGVLQHEEIYESIKEHDALIMPFQLNETVLAVDPVKLYEYISFGKCIISIYYPEIERFEPFVYFYKNSKEYNELIEDLCVKGFPPKYTKKQQEEFLEENTWEKRYETIKEKLNEL